MSAVETVPKVGRKWNMKTCIKETRHFPPSILFFAKGFHYNVYKSHGGAMVNVLTLF